jgi:hypothetical protein
MPSSPRQAAVSKVESGGYGFILAHRLALFARKQA